MGLLLGPAHAHDDGQPTRYLALANAAGSPYRYEIDAEEQARLMPQLEDGGEVVWAIVHSHVASPAVPSSADIGQALYPDSLHLICSLAEPVPVVRAWSIRDGEVAEVTVAVG